jgi:hypothetical protein
MSRLTTMNALALAGGVLAVVPPAQAAAPTCRPDRGAVRSRGVGTPYDDVLLVSAGRRVGPRRRRRRSEHSGQPSQVYGDGGQEGRDTCLNAEVVDSCEALSP